MTGSSGLYTSVFYDLCYYGGRFCRKRLLDKLTLCRSATHRKLVELLFSAKPFPKRGWGSNGYKVKSGSLAYPFEPTCNRLMNDLTPIICIAQFHSNVNHNKGYSEPLHNTGGPQ